MKKIHLPYFKDIMFFMIIISYGFHSLGEILPTAINQVLIFLMFIGFIIDKSTIKQDFTLNKYVFVFLLSIVIITYIINLNYVDSRTIQTTIQVIIYFLTYFWIINYDKQKFYKIVKVYINIIFFLSIIALIQEISYLINIEFLYDLKSIGVQSHNISSVGPFLRVYSLTTEPSHFAEISSAAMIICLGRLFSPYFKEIVSKSFSLTIIIAFLFTFSLLAYIFFFSAILFYIVYTINIKRKLIIIMITIISALLISINYQSLSKNFLPFVKLNLFINNAKNLNTYSSKDIDHLSVFAILSNYKVTKRSFYERPFVGTGLDSYRKAYEHYIPSTIGNVKRKLNKDNAGSLYFRLITEFGLLFIILFIIILSRYYIKKDKDIKIDSVYLLNKIFLLSFLLESIRNGTYLFPGKWIFLSFYITSFQFYIYKIKDISKKIYNKN